MIAQAHGNLLQADVDALVNTVNTVGVMGKGIALQFKRAFPAMFEDYARAAKRHELALGTMHVWPTDSMTGPRFVINFPTKGHWKAGSRLTDIERGLDDLVRVIEREGIRSIAVPPLGCGNGGLDWAVVEPLIRSKLAPLTGVEILVYPPSGAPAAADMPTAGARPPMTPGRAALVQLLAQYSRHALGDASLVEVQKLAYFLQVAGEQLRLDFAANHYGPYADALRHVLVTIEGHYLSGFGDGSARVHESEPLKLMPGAEAIATAALVERPDTVAHLSRVLELIEGFETPYGLELLATAHWVLTHQAVSDDEAVVAAVRDWSPRKGRMFTTSHVVVAIDTLRNHGWTAELAAAR